MRGLFAPNKPMERTDYNPLFVGAETARATICILNCFSKLSPAYTKKELRDDIVRECKALRHNTEKKESELFKPVFLAEVMNVLWDR